MKLSPTYNKTFWNIITIFTIIYVMGFVITPGQMQSTNFINQGIMLNWGLLIVNSWWTILVADIIESKDPYEADICSSITLKLKSVSILSILAFCLAYSPVTKKNSLIASFIGSIYLIDSFIYSLREAYILCLAKKQA